MKVKIASDHPLTDEACKAATGKTFPEWFAVIDGLGGPAIGRKPVNDHLYGELKIDMWWIATINNLYEAQKAVVEKDGRAKGFNICVTKTVAAPLDKLYNAWTDPALLAKWFGEGTKADVVDGGMYSNADGDKGTPTSAFWTEQGLALHVGESGSRGKHRRCRLYRQRQRQDLLARESGPRANEARGRRVAQGLGRGGGSAESIG